MKPIIKDRYKNSLERRYADYLYRLQLRKEIVSYMYEPFGLRLADKTFYHPDFLVIYPGHFEIHETKGFLRDDANVKIKVAAKMFSFWNFKMIFWKNKQWIVREYK